MPVKLLQMRYLILTRKNLSNLVEEKALRTKSTERIYKFLLENIIYRYGCVKKITADREKLNTQEARKFFKKYEIKLSLTTAYNPEKNAKNERGHPLIMKALVKACNGKVKE
ncbi:hypothetical protein GCM10010495_82590 [Kitasatospora herbaricolor]|nr:hypothetical protein GCM10010495_82590 [Kitasatospora herbaricolor]